MARRAHVRSVVPRFVLLALAVAPAGMGCQFQPGSLSGNPGTPDAMAVPDDAPPPLDDGPRPIDAPLAIDAPPPPDTGPRPDAAPLPDTEVLVSRGLLTRYFIDEATDGTAPTVLEDAAPDPLDLTITYAENGAFVDTDNNRGLRWTSITDTGKAQASLIEEGKVWVALDGSRTGTIEVVVDVDQFLGGSRLSHLGENEDSGVFSLRLDDDGVTLVWNNEDPDDDGGEVVWDVDVLARDRTVMHVVFDTTLGNAADRVKLYLDGEAQTSTGGAPPAQNDTIVIVNNSSTEYTLANREADERSIAGTLFYTSMYSTALSQDEVAHNFAILNLSDDGPGR